MILINKGASKVLVRGNRYVFPGEEYECSKEEAEHRKKVTPNLWEISGESEKVTKKEAVKTADKPVKVSPKREIGSKVTK